MEGSLVLRVNGTNYPSPRKMGRKGVMTGLLAWNLGAISVDLRLLVEPLGQIPCWARALKSRPDFSGRLAFNLLKRSCASKLHSRLEVGVAGNAMRSHFQSFLLFLFANPQPNGELQESKHNQ